MIKILLLGGTTEARQIAEGLADCDDIEVILSLAGVTPSPHDMGVAVRIGGFGGREGLCRYLVDEAIDVLIDATHPYASRISAHAATACRKAKVERLCLWRPPWQAEGRGQIFPAWDSLLGAIPDGARVFMAAGQDGLNALGEAPYRFEVFARTLAPPNDSNDGSITYIKGLPKNSRDEAILFKRHDISHIVCKNSGGRASMGKILGAEKLGLPVLMLARPDPPPPPLYDDAEAILKVILGKIKP